MSTSTPAQNTTFRSGASPYVGPRPFEREDEGYFFGRDKEVNEVVCTIVAHDASLLSAMSGAGKTSLLKAAVIPQLEREGFDVLPVARIQGDVPSDTTLDSINNIYAFHAILSWLDADANASEFARMSLSEYLEKRPVKFADAEDSDTDPCPKQRILIFDQFEELFTSFADRWDEREHFFMQLEELLIQRDRRRPASGKNRPTYRVLLVMREDYVDRLSEYLDFFPDRLRSRYRLQPFTLDAASEAIERPARLLDRQFTAGATAYLTSELSEIKTQDANGNPVTASGRFVEPVQLQVVCDSLWRQLPEDIKLVTLDDVKSLGSVDNALRRFYESAIATACNSSGFGEKELRLFFERELITSSGTRGNVFRGQTNTGQIPNSVIDELANLHILRCEIRSSGRWYELTHDRLIAPIQESNREYSHKHLGRQLETANVKVKRLQRGRNTIVRVALCITAILLGLALILWRTADANYRESQKNLQKAEDANIKRELDLSVPQITEKQDYAAAYPLVFDAMRKAMTELDVGESEKLAGFRLRLAALRSQLPSLCQFVAVPFRSQASSYAMSENGQWAITFDRGEHTHPESNGALFLYDYGSKAGVQQSLAFDGILREAAISGDGTKLFIVTTTGIFWTDREEVTWKSISSFSNVELARGGLIPSYTGKTLAIVPSTSGTPIQIWREEIGQYVDETQEQIKSSKDSLPQLSDSCIAWLDIASKASSESKVSTENERYRRVSVMIRNNSGATSNWSLHKPTDDKPGSRSGDRDEDVSFFSLSRDGNLLFTANASRGSISLLDGQQRPLNLQLTDIPTSARFSNDGTSLAIGCRDGYVYLYSCTETGRIPLAARRISERHSSWVRDVHWSDDDRYLVTAGRDKMVRVWHAADGLPACPPLHHESSVSFAVTSGDCRYVSSVSQSINDRKLFMRVWDLSLGDSVIPLSQPGVSIFHAQLTRHGKYVLTFGFEGDKENAGRLGIWNVKDRTLAPQSELMTKHAPLLAVIAEDGNRVVAVQASEDTTPELEQDNETATVIDLWERADQGQGYQRQVLDRKLGDIHDIALLPNGRELAVAYVDTATQKAAVDWWDLDSRQTVTPNLHSNGPQAEETIEKSEATRVMFIGDEYLVAAVDVQLDSTSLKGEAHVWKFDKQRRLTWIGKVSHDEGTITHLGAHLALGTEQSYLVTCGTDDAARVWSLPGLTEKTKIEHTADVAYASFSDNGEYIATAGYDGVAHLALTTTGRIVKSLPHKGPVTFLAFQRGWDDRNQLLITGSIDHRVRLFGIETDDVFTIGELLLPSSIARVFPGDGQSRVLALAFPAELPGAQFPSPMRRNRDRYENLSLYGGDQPQIFLGDWRLGDSDQMKDSVDELRYMGQLFSATKLASEPVNKNEKEVDRVSPHYLIESWNNVGSKLSGSYENYDEIWSWRQALDAQSQRKWAAAKRHWMTISENSKEYYKHAMLQLELVVDEELRQSSDEANEYAARNQWKEAITKYESVLRNAKTSHLTIDSTTVGFEYGLCLKMEEKANGNRSNLSRFQGLCQGMLDDLPNLDLEASNLAIWLAVLDKESVKSWAALIDRARQNLANDGDEKSHLRNTLAGLLVRSGAYQEAIDLILRNSNSTSFGDSSDLLVLSLAYASLGGMDNQQKVKQNLSKLREYKSSNDYSRLSWTEQAQIELLLEELSHFEFN